MRKLIDHFISACGLILALCVLSITVVGSFAVCRWILRAGGEVIDEQNGAQVIFASMLLILVVAGIGSVAIGMLKKG